MSRLIIATDGADTDASTRDAITAFLEAKGWSVWHWFQDLWLIDSGVGPPIIVEDLRLEMKAAIPTMRRIMITLMEGHILRAGTVPTDGIPWLIEHWSPPPET